MPIKPGDPLPQDAVVGQQIPEGATVGDYNPPQPGILDASPEYGMMEHIGGGIRGAASSVLSPLIHPIDTLRSMGESQIGAGRTPYGAPIFSAGPGEGANRRNIGIGETTGQRQLEASQKGWQESPGYMTGSIAGPLMFGEGIRRFSAPVESLPPVMQARGLTRAINPIESDRPAMIRNLQEQGGNIPEFAKRTGMTTKTPLEFAAASRGAAEEAHNFFKNEIMAPIADVRIPTPKGYGGHVSHIEGGGQFGHGGDISLGELDQRITSLNDQLRSNYDKRQGGQTREALANDADLKAEANALNEVLYKEVGKRAGLAPEEVKAIRQRFGSLYDIADKTNAAVNRREAGVDTTAEGRSTLPMSKLGMITQGASKLFNLDPESIANRRLGRALGRFTIEPTELPPIRRP